MQVLEYRYKGKPTRMTWSAANEAIVKAEADDGIYTIYDDGADPEVIEDTLGTRVTELEEALTLLLEGATE